MNRKTCIIGAGASGLAAVKVLSERGLPFDCFEMGSDLGGLWRLDNETGRSPAYESLRTNTSREKTAYSDFPMPASYPDYPTHQQVLAYLESYAEHFGLRRHIRFRSRVDRVRPLEGGGYEVTWRALDDGTTHVARYRSVIVASGHHWKPNRPVVPGAFEGTVMHAKDYRRPDQLAGRRVLVVGIGNSACDIVCEVSRIARRTVLSTRRSAHVIPKYLLGRPLDHWLTPLNARLPFPMRRGLFKLLIFLERGPQSRYGLPVPEHDLGEEHPTISTELLPLIKQGAITPKPDLEAFCGDRIRFVDGSEEPIDVVVFATGYLISFPFLDFLEVRDNQLPLYLHVAHPSYPHLYFLGLIQPLGAIPLLAEAQSEWVADLLEGRAVLPDEHEMVAAIRRDAEARRRRYVDSKRHRIEIEVHPYLRELKRARGRTAPEESATA